MAGDAATPTESDWLALVDKVLRGRDFDEVLVTELLDGISVAPLYTDAATVPATGVPGAAPYVRGTRGPDDAPPVWDIRARHGHPEPAVLNERIRRDLERGVTSIELLTVGIDTLDQLDQALDGVYLDLAPISLRPGPDYLAAGSALLALLDRRGIAPEDARHALGADPISAMAIAARFPFDESTAMAQAMDLVAHCADRWPAVRVIRADGAVVHNAGASDVQELAFVAASLVASARSAERAGIDLETFVNHVEVGLVATADQFSTIAKLRAFRRVLEQIGRAIGVADLPARVTTAVTTSAAMLTERDPWVNVLRSTVATFAAAVGGADSVAVLPFDLAAGIPDELGMRLARNTQLILHEESRLGHVIDPAGGSFYVESLTDELAREAWAGFQRIEAGGGVIATLAGGQLADEVSGVAERRRRAIASRRQPITGVSEFPLLSEERLERNPPISATSLDADSVAALDLPDPGGGRLTDAVIAAVTSGTPLPAISAAGASDDPFVNSKPLGLRRWAEPFEAFRAASDAYLDRMGRRPVVHLVNLGPPAVHAGRSSWARGLFESGGIEVIATDGHDDVSAAAEAYAASGTPIAVLCSTDDVYSELAAPIADALNAAGAKRVYLAGRPGEHEAAWRDAGVDEFIHVGADLVDALDRAHEVLEVTPS